MLNTLTFANNLFSRIKSLNCSKTLKLVTKQIKRVAGTRKLVYIACNMMN